MRYYGSMKLITYTDGGARGNPGPAGIGVVIKNVDGDIIESYGKYIGHQTNNVAEYTALLEAVISAQKLGATDLVCYLDSELVVKQMNRVYKVKNQNLASIFIKIWNLSQTFNSIVFKHVRREKNKEADALVNEALDAQKK